MGEVNISKLITDLETFAEKQLKCEWCGAYICVCPMAEYFGDSGDICILQMVIEKLKEIKGEEDGKVQQ